MLTAIHLETTGMFCPECPFRIESGIRRLKGVEHVVACRSLSLTSVLYDETVVNEAAIAGAIHDAGFAAHVIRRSQSGPA